MFGYSADEMLGQELARLMLADVRDAHGRLVARFGEDRDDSRLMGERANVRDPRRDGSEFFAEAVILRVDHKG